MYCMAGNVGEKKSIFHNSFFSLKTLPIHQIKSFPIFPAIWHVVNKYINFNHQRTLTLTTES